MDVREIWTGCVDWIYLEQDRDVYQGLAQTNKPSGTIKIR